MSVTVWMAAYARIQDTQKNKQLGRQLGIFI